MQSKSGYQGLACLWRDQGIRKSGYQGIGIAGYQERISELEKWWIGQLARKRTLCDLGALCGYESIIKNKPNLLGFRFEDNRD
jgi:hypothetical protein